MMLVGGIREAVLGNNAATGFCFETGRARRSLVFRILVVLRVLSSLISRLGCIVKTISAAVFIVEALVNEIMLKV